MAKAEASETQVKSQKQANIPEKLRVVWKHLGKSRSALSTVATTPAGPISSRRDDSLLQQQDGIQSATLHCKRSFNASRGMAIFDTMRHIRPNVSTVQECDDRRCASHI